MSKTRRFFYWTILVFLTFHYYAVIETLYLELPADQGEKGLITSLVALVNMPLNLALALVRLWTLKPIEKRNIYFESAYFAIPILIIGFCVAELNWGGIIVSLIGGVLPLYEVSRNILKNDYVVK